MHIYIRTGDNENTGIEFLNGKGWELFGYERKGFTYTPPAGETHRYVFKEGFKSKVLPFQGSEKALAAMVLAVEELRSVDGEQEIKTVTWIREGHDKIHNLLKMLGLNGSTWTAEPLRDEIQHIIYTYMNKVPNPVEVSVTDEDFGRVTFDNTKRDNSGYLVEDEPQGFSVTFGDTVEHYAVPEFLRHAVFMLKDEQETLAEAILLSDKLSKLEPGEPVTTTVHNFMGKIKEPAPAGEVLERLQPGLCAYTVNDVSKIIVIDGNKSEEEAKVREVNIDEKALAFINFNKESCYRTEPKLVSDEYFHHSIHKIGFDVETVSGRVWKFTPLSRDTRYSIFLRKFEDRALAVAALAVMGVADTHGYYGELRVVSNFLGDTFQEKVNGILRGRDFYTIIEYFKGLFKVEKVSS